MDPGRPLPRGTVTFLFTDIEGSTRLLGHLGPERYSALLAQHHRLLREAFQQAGGHELDSQGDGFFVVFARAADALAAAIAAQRALAAYPWPESAAVRVRMGLHTGEPTLTEADYLGLDVHRAARIVAAGHGGQVLLSQTTRDLVEPELPAGVSLRELGSHRLKDLPQPEPLFQLVIAGLPADFPLLRSLEAHPHNLPAPSTPLIGREEEDAALRDLLGQAVGRGSSAVGRDRPVHTESRWPGADGPRLVTLTGPGGTGKTRLGLQVAAELLEGFADGVFFVALASIRDPALVASTIAQTLGVRESPGQTLLESLKEYLKPKQQLLLLDNFEQVLPAAPLISELLAACPKLKALVTSRAALHLQGEREFPVPLLPVPAGRDEERPGRSSSSLVVPPPSSLTACPSVRLFAERALAVRPDFALTSENAAEVAAICRRLEGLPLAIELAAARIRLLPPAALLSRLEKRLKLLVGGPRDLPARQRTLRDTIAWSDGLLAEPERRLLHRLSVFVGGCTLEAAEAVGNPEGELGIDILDGIEALVDWSLLRRDDAGGGPRFSMLETVREYAHEALEASGEAVLLRRRHAEFFRAWMAKTGEEPQEGWLRRLAADHNNLRAVLAWSESEEGEAELELRIVGALWRFWSEHGHWSEGRERLMAALQRNPGSSPALRMTALYGAWCLALSQGDFAAMRRLAEERLSVAREAGDQPAISLSLQLLSTAALNQGEGEVARSLLRESLDIYRATADHEGEARALYALGNVAWNHGDFTTAHSAYEACLALQQEAKLPAFLARLAHGGLGLVAASRGELERACFHLEQSLRISRETRDVTGMCQALDELGEVFMSRGEPERARALFEEALALRQQTGDRHEVTHSLWELGILATHQDDYPAARSYFQESAAILRELGGRRYLPFVLQSLGAVALLHGDHVVARSALEEAIAIARQTGHQWGLGYSLQWLGLMADAEGDYPQARAALEESVEIWRTVGAKEGSCLPAALNNLALVVRHEGDLHHACSLCEESLRLAREVGARPQIVATLVGAAGLALARGHAGRAACLLGAAEALRRAIGLSPPPLERRRCEQELAAVRAVLSEEAFAAAWAEGDALALGEAVRLALQEPLAGVEGAAADSPSRM